MYTIKKSRGMFIVESEQGMHSSWNTENEAQEEANRLNAIKYTGDEEMLLDRLAGQAMQGILISLCLDGGWECEVVAQDSYQQAAAMLEERKKYIK